MLEISRHIAQGDVTPLGHVPPTQPAPYKQRNERAYSYSAHNSRP